MTGFGSSGLPGIQVYATQGWHPQSLEKRLIIRLKPEIRIGPRLGFKVYPRIRGFWNLGAVSAAVRRFRVAMVSGSSLSYKPEKDNGPTLDGMAIKPSFLKLCP